MKPNKFFNQMTNIFNNLLKNLIPYLPISIVKIFARKYVAGETNEQVINIIRKLNSDGFSATVDILGEHVSSISDAETIVNEYLKLYELIHQNKLDCNISVKPTHIGLDLSSELFESNTRKLLNKAVELNNFLRIDMESSSVTDITIYTYQKLLSDYHNLGTVFQAYLYRTFKDITSQNSSLLNFRLCKGIYNEPERIAIKDRFEINDNFLKILKYAFEHNIYVGIATHDIDLIKNVYTLINDLKVEKYNFEFQVLYGVPMSGWLEKHLKNGYKVRVYVPFGKDWYEYSIRRLKENPNIIGYIFNNLFRKS